ncbi:hypothetical protein FG386_002584 [Cryptosporidium ryanae]|uniref:uncharacterized protein n=1 Tax=Cryptosporidium ryanae TaxID=515981 RepID=UPI00351A1097|nr:hypothetical protein FG386_002584 [Cryptosporidium ryanae]
MRDFNFSRSELKKYESEVSSILQSFEKAQEWADLSNCLQRLHRCINKEFSGVPGVPLKEIVSKRLAQCLNPSLPSGVHTKALETYDAIFEKIEKSELSLDLALYGSGLFPFFVHSSTQVKPIFLDLIEKYFLPLGPSLLPCLSGLLVGLLPGVEDPKSECYERLMKTFQLISNDNCVGEKNFMSTLWLILLRTTHVRYSAFEVIMSKFQSNNSSLVESELNSKKIRSLIPCNNLFIKALESCFYDENVYVKRYLIDFLIAHVPLKLNHNFSKSDNDTIDDILTFESKIKLLRKALRLLLLKEWSLTRRLIQWISNKNSPNKSSDDIQITDNSSIRFINTAIIEEFLHSFSVIDRISAVETERTMRFWNSNSMKLSKQYSNFNISPVSVNLNTISTNVLQPLKVTSALFQEHDYCIKFTLPEILIPLLLFSKKSVDKIPELKYNIVVECRSLLNSSNFPPSQFIDSIRKVFDKVLKKESVSFFIKDNSEILNPSVTLLQEVIIFYVDNIIDTEDGSKEGLLDMFLVNLLKTVMSITVNYTLENQDSVVLASLCLYILKKMKNISDNGEVFDNDFSAIIKVFVENIFKPLYLKSFDVEDIPYRKLLYSLLASFCNLEVLRRVTLRESKNTDLPPFGDFSIPVWLYNIYNRCVDYNIDGNSSFQLNDYIVDDIFRCLEITIEIFFKTNFLITNNSIPHCWVECINNIMNLLWIFLNPELIRFHKESTSLFISLEEWVNLNIDFLSKDSINSENQNQSNLLRGNSILSQFFINHLSVYDNEIKILNIKKLAAFIKYSTDSLYKIPNEVTFLILEGLDSNSIQLRTISSVWVIQAIETPILIFDHLLDELLNQENFISINGNFRFNDEIDFRRLIYTLDRLITLISMENLNVIQIMVDTEIEKPHISDIIGKYDIKDYFDVFIYVCLIFSTMESKNPFDFPIQRSAVNTLNTILNKSSLLSNTFSTLKKLTHFQTKLFKATELITNHILGALQSSIISKKMHLQITIIQLLQTILLIQRPKNIEDSQKNNKNQLLFNNDKLFPIIILGLQQTLTGNDVEAVDNIDLFEERDVKLPTTNFSNLSSYSSPIKHYIDFCLLIIEELDLESLIQNTTSIIITLCLELVSSIVMNNHNSIIQYFDSILRVLLHVVGVPSVSNTLFSSELDISQTGPGFVQSLFNWQKEEQTSIKKSVHISSITPLPKLINFAQDSNIESISVDSKKSIIKNTVLTLFSTLVEALYYIHEKDSDSKSKNSVSSQIIEYSISIAFLLAWNASDAFVFSGIVCWSHINNQIIKTKTNNNKNISISSNSRNIAIISIFQFDSILKLINLGTIFSISGEFLTYFWLKCNCLSDSQKASCLKSNEDLNETRGIPNYLVYFSRTFLKINLIYCYHLWKESLVFHFLYTITVTYSFTVPDEFIFLWNTISSLLNTFIHKVKQPKSVLWFACLISTLDGCMASSKSIPSSFFLDRNLLNIFEEKKLLKNLNNLIFMILFLVNGNFSSKISGAVQPQQYDKLPPLPPSIEAMLQSIEFSLPISGKSSGEASMDINECPKAIISDDPTLLFSYYSMGFLIMYNIEISYHSNKKRLLLMNIWGNSIVKSLNWVFQPLLKRNNDVANMLHKYFLMLHIDTFPYRIFNDYLPGIKKSVIDAINSQDFFLMDRRTFRCWINVVSRLVSHDITSISTAERVNIINTYVPVQSMGIFSTRDAELQNVCSHIKRLAFLIFCCPKNTFQMHLSLILEKLVENLKLAPEYLNNTEVNKINPHFILLAEQIILCLRVLLLKVQYQALMPLWPIVLTELIRIFRSKKHQRLVISAMKFVDLASLLDIPEFHLYQWIFVTDFFSNSENSLEEKDDSGKKDLSSENDVFEKDEDNKKISTFSPFCRVVSENNDDSNSPLLGINMDIVNEAFQNGLPRYPLIYYHEKTTPKRNISEIASFLDKNCLLNSIRSPKINNDKIIRSIEDDFLDFPENLLDLSTGSDPLSLFTTISDQKFQLKNDCMRYTQIQS